MRKFLLASVAVAAGAVLTSPAMATPVSCAVGGSIATYEAYGSTGCSVDGGAIVFSNIVVTPQVGNGGVVTLTSLTPFNTGNEWGLTLSYISNAASSNSQADVAWQYNVSASPPLVDAYASFTGTTTGTGTATLSETLSNGVTLSLNGPGSTTVDFPPVSNLFVVKDQNDFAGTAGSSEFLFWLTGSR